MSRLLRIGLALSVAFWLPPGSRAAEEDRLVVFEKALDALGARYGIPGLYQFNIRVPRLSDPDPTVSIEVAGERTQPGVVIPVITNSK